MSEEFELPEDPAELQAWMDNFAEKLAWYAPEIGVSPEQLAQVQEARQFFRAELQQAVSKALVGQRQRLAAACPEAKWPRVITEAWQRALITREPERSQGLRLVEALLTGIERAHAGAVQPQLACGYFPAGIRVEFTIPPPCDMATVYFRLRGKALWELLGIYTSPSKYLLTSPEYQELNERKDWPGRTLEFMAVGRFEGQHFGFPSEPVASVVPVVYPVVTEEPGR